jgi:energy-coupling factor transporter ATP-binding protein EcfA2
MLSRPLRELFGVWHDTRLIVLVAQTAALYAAILIPFKMGIPLIPGYSELRPANAIPLVASLLFGPVAAWGAAFGNLIGDCFGTLGPGSVFGFIGNFCYGLVPYLLWGRLGPLSSGADPVPRSVAQIFELAVVGLAASLACAAAVAWGVDLLGLLPFRILAPAIFLNNAVMGSLLAPPLLLFLHPRVKRWGLRYQDIVRGRVSGVGPQVSGPGEDESPPANPEHLTPNIRHLPPDTRPLTPNTDLIVEARNVTFTYAGADNPALSALSLSIRPGEAVALMGRSGAGKSTLCYALNGLVPHHLTGRWSGALSVHGYDTRHRPAWQQAASVGVVFQDFETQLVATNVERELSFPLEHLPRPSSEHERAEWIARVLARVGLSGMERRHPLTLSGGERQRLVIASVLIRQPAVVSLDEPATDLDPVGRRTLAGLLAALKAEGTTTVLADHDPEETVKADRLCVLDEGRLVWEGAPRALFGRPDQTDLAASFGLRPLPLAECFDGLGLRELPLTVEEAWAAAKERGVGVTGTAPASAHLPETPVVLRIDRASYAYPSGATAVTELDLTVRKGEFVALVGHNGCGKSTLASLLNGLRLPTEGRVMVNGRDTRTLGVAGLAGTVGYVFQNPDHQIFAETVAEEVAFAARNLGCSPEVCERRVAAALRAVGLDASHIRRLDPFSLTKGERQRVAVASVLAAQPEILIFDEPTTGLDARETDRMMGMIRGLNHAGHTIIMITHALGLAAAYARRCLVLHDGRLAADGPTREVFRRLLDEECAASLGLELPPVTRFAARWDVTLLTPAEVRAALTREDRR